MYGSAYDGPFDARAYTYDHLPGNDPAWAIGRAASNALKEPAGDYIDRGLGLLRHLQDAGFGVFALNDNDATSEASPARAEAAEAKCATLQATLDQTLHGWGEDAVKIEELQAEVAELRAKVAFLEAFRIGGE